MKSRQIEVLDPPQDLKNEFDVIFTQDAVDFVLEVISHFDNDVDHMLHRRVRTGLDLQDPSKLPNFVTSKARSDPAWKIADLPRRLQNVKLTIGDLSPSNTNLFESYLSTDVQALQVDFDDGHCPTWRNQLIGWNNIYRATHGLIPNVSSLEASPVLLIRPRAWNMIDHSVMISGKKVPGALLDFALILYHNGRLLHESGSGPFLFLSKLEGSGEAELWDKIFTWTEKRLKLPHGAIKACVLIENILAAYEMDEILFNLRDHIMGLNCGIWDYSASMINKFGSRKDFLIPDRSLYVNMTRPFLKSYMDLVIQTCHKRGALATGGMTATLLSELPPEEKSAAMAKMCDGKRSEILAGVDGFLFYDFEAFEGLKSLWNGLTTKPNQLDITRTDVSVCPEILVTLPKGGVSMAGFLNNIKVGVLFIQSWLKGKGVFYWNGQVEDSATAEISRSQIWQWIRHSVKIEESGATITRELVFAKVDDFIAGVVSKLGDQEEEDLQEAAQLFKVLVTAQEFPEFITTYLYENYAFMRRHSLI